MATTGSTANYQAAAQANDAVIAYAMEANYGVAATGAFQKTRFTGENFRPQNTRQRPDEINDLAEASQAVTTQEAVSGTLSGALSISTYDDLLAAVLCGDWTNDSVANGKIVKTWTLIEKLGAEWFVRPGSFCTRVQLTFTQGSFSQVAFDFSCADQTVSAADPAQSYLNAPSGTVLDTVQNFEGVQIDGATPEGCIRSIQITLTRNGADSDYGTGHTGACGIRVGEMLATGQLQIFFKTYDLYQRYVAGKGGPIALTVGDGSGAKYVFTFLNATLQNPQINAGSKNTSVIATFDIEGNPQAGGGTFRIDRTAGPGNVQAGGNDVTAGGNNVQP